MEVSSVIPRILPTEASVIGYTPIGNEPDYRALLPRLLGSQDLLLPPTADYEPFYCADLCERHFERTPVSLFIPGTRFDLRGTRHGRGGGWYDRFLASVPKDWIRVGVMKLSQIAAVPLTRNEWDQPVDWLLAFDGTSWQAFETHARTKGE